MMWKIFSKTKALKSDLLSFKNEPLSGLSVFFLIVLDLFIFFNVLIGIDGEVSKVPKPSIYYPYECTTHFKSIKSEYSGFDDRGNAYTYKIKKKISPYCSELDAKIKQFSETALFKTNLKKIRSIEEKITKNNKQVNVINKQYNTRLFERIAQMPNNKALVNAKNEYNALLADNKKLEAEKAAIAKVTTLKGYDEYKRYVESSKNAFNEAKKSYKFWQPFKEFGKVLLFILPLLLVFGFLYYRSKKKELRGEQYNPVIKIISTHIALILALPVIYYTLYIIYHVMPKTLLKQLIDFLMQIGLLSILNYLAIGVIVIVFGFIIYFIQKKTLQHKQVGSSRNIKKIISWSQCFHCDYKVDYTKPYCPYCGEKLLEKCPHCDELKIRNLPYCQHCGKSDSDESKA